MQPEQIESNLRALLADIEMNKPSTRSKDIITLVSWEYFFNNKERWLKPEMKLEDGQKEMENKTIEEWEERNTEILEFR